MKIAFISYEYPPDTAYGGIATYVQQAARMLHGRGHYVEVFSGSPSRSGSLCQDGILVHRIQVAEQADFAQPVGRVFSERHALVQFDVLEGPEFYADAREAVRLVPDIPLVVKLHTPSLLLLHLNYEESSLVRKVGFCVRALLTGVAPTWGYDPRIASHRIHILHMNRIEQSHALQADEIATPSRSLGHKLIDVWGLEPSMVSHVPYPYTPVQRLLRIPAETQTRTVTFVGRLEVRKGVLDLARAIPRILRCLPDTTFRFVGPSDVSPHPELDMQQYLERMLRRYRRSIEFTGPVAIDTIPEILAGTDVCIFPSRWENFPYVCLEAMAAARGIVGSRAGGMYDMLDAGRVGRLVLPRRPQDMAGATLELIGHPDLRMRLGQAARQRLLTEYSADRVGVLQEASYARAITHRKTLGPRARHDCVAL